MSSNITADLAQTVRRASALHQTGRLAEAERLYRRVLSADPNQFEALHFLGLIEAQRENFEEANRLMRRSLQVNTRTADAFSNHARVLNALKRSEEALAASERALEINPRLLGAMVSRGIALTDLRRITEAIANYDQALAIDPHYLPALANRGNGLFALGRNVDALECHQKVVAVDPRNRSAWLSLAKVLSKLHRATEAIDSYQRALAIDPQFREALVGVGDLLRDLGRYDEALANYDKALAIKADDTALLTGRAQVLGLMDRIEEALSCCDAALSLDGNHVAALVTRGDALTALLRPGDALESYDRALKIDPNSVLALNNRSNALQSLNRHEEAKRELERALSLAPDYADAHLNRALVLFRLGDFHNAWREYEWRWKCPHWPEKPRPFREPLWLGQLPLAGKSILLHAEQGLGDTLQFVRYAAVLADRGARVFLEVQPALKALASQIRGIDKVSARGEDLPSCDFQCPLLSLPLAFNAGIDSIPKNVPYLTAPADRIETWKARFAPQEGFRVGLVWSGNPRHRSDLARSVPLECLAPLLQMPGIHFVTLQKDIRDSDLEVLRAHSQITVLALDFVETAAVISQLDLVIAVDTSLAHLAGALGKPLWVLLSFSPDWRWMIGRNDSPWYPTARLFRQERVGQWDGVIAQVQRELYAISSERPACHAPPSVAGMI